MREQFPNFVLEDKDVIEGDKNDANEVRGMKIGIIELGGRGSRMQPKGANVEPSDG